MMLVVTDENTHELDRYQLSSSIPHIRFYRSAPRSCLEYVGEINPGATRGDNGHLFRRTMG
jgi:hypothetical protein